MFRNNIPVVVKDSQQEKDNREFKEDGAKQKISKLQHKLFHKKSLIPKKYVRFIDEIKLERRRTYP